MATTEPTVEGLADPAGTRRRVVVGVDGSDGSRAALQWACTYAARLGPVVPVTTFLPGPFVRGFATSGGNDPSGEPYRRVAREKLVTTVREVDPSLVEAAQVIERRTGPGLIEAAADARLLVVGHRGASERPDLSIGSVGAYCVRNAPVPVAVIPGDVTPAADHPLVVCGVDGSDESLSALRWALRHVQAPGRLIALRIVPTGTVAGDPFVTGVDATESAALAELEQMVFDARRDVGECLEADIVLEVGDPQARLREASVDADLVVIGARGRGAIRHLLLGSVATALSHHPLVPTIVVREPA